MPVLDFGDGGGARSFAASGASPTGKYPAGGAFQSLYETGVGVWSNGPTGDLGPAIGQTEGTTLQAATARADRQTATAVR